VNRRAALAPLGAILLGAASVAWSAAPPVHKGEAGVALFLVIACVTGGALRLAFYAVPLPEDSFLLPGPFRALIGFLRAVRIPPWEEGAVIAAAWLEVLHPARPWHTAVLGAVLTAYLLAVHLAESGATTGGTKTAATTTETGTTTTGLFRSQAPVLAIGACLLALGAGAGMLPILAPGPGSALLRVVAAVAVIAAAGLVLPW
jgi:hypothetical protein